MSSSYNVEKLKAYEVKILDKFVSICKKNNLNYYLAYGTLLGAIRHKGFIPWDDDIDVYMKAEDYYKFKEIMKENPVDGYFYQSLETEKYYSLSFAKLRMNNTSVVEKKLAEEKIHNGIYIDIFPLLPYPNSKKDQDKLFNDIKMLNLLIEADLIDRTKYNSYGKSGKILSSAFRIIPRSIRNKVAQTKLKKIISSPKEYDNYICIFDHKIFDKKLFDKETKVLFEGKEYTAPKEYDKYLTAMYGDYMTPPPKNNRNGHSFLSVNFQNKNNEFNEKIDFVIPWVDGGDPEWQKEKNKYDKTKKVNTANSSIRYRDWDNLKYWFRGVEKYAPWVNNIYFITWGHLPEWLNTNHPKLKIINHKDYIPKEYLPVFSSHPIEFNIHRIKGLSEQFVLFNDDMFIINKMDTTDFFKDGKPCDNYNEVNWDPSGEDPIFASILQNNYDILNKYYNKRRVILKNIPKYINIKYGLKRNLQTIKTTLTHSKFVGINNNHIPQSFLKRYFVKLWKIQEKTLIETSSHKFRDKKDINQYLIKYFQILDGNFVPRDFKMGKYFSVKQDNSELTECIKKQKVQCVCINDSDKNIDFEKCKTEINEAFEEILGEKSSFEK